MPASASAPAPAPALIGLAEIQAAAQLLDGITRVTPMLESRVLSELVGGPVLLKCENLQRTGSFKPRGAYVRISRLDPAARAAGVVAASAGNHAQGVALAASLLDTRATVYMPVGAPLPKLAATRGYGAVVRFVDGTVDDCLVAAAEECRRTGATLIHPFDHPDVLTGQGTVGLEIAEQCPQVRTVVVSAGGGGLLGGIAAALGELCPQATVVGVQAEGAAAYPASLTAGTPVPLARMTTMADGIAIGCPGQVPFAHVRALVDRVVTVSEESLSRALLLCLERAKQLVEPAGAAAVAALLDDPSAFPPPVVAVLSGGNVDPVLLMRVLQRGMVAAGRYLSLDIRISDRPGGLAGLLAVLAATGASVLEVDHRRTGVGLELEQVAVSVSVETRGPEHGEAVLAALAAAGYPVATAGG